MHDHAGNVLQPMRVGNQLVVGVEEAAIDEIVALDAREGEGVVILGEAAHPLGVGQQRQRLAFPGAPGPRGFELHGWIGIGEAAVIGFDQIAALGLGDHAQILLEGVGEDPATAFLIEPFELRAPQREDASQHELGHALWVCLGVSERERGAP